jgi:hypothetical protein
MTDPDHHIPIVVRYVLLLLILPLSIRKTRSNLYPRFESRMGMYPRQFEVEIFHEDVYWLPGGSGWSPWKGSSAKVLLVLDCVQQLA